jgi:hypothetical protein
MATCRYALEGLITVSVLASALVVLGPLAARAADAAYCQDYAHATLDQVETGLAIPACAGGMKGNRWSQAFQAHFVYCMSNPSSAVETLRGERSDYLRSCGALH